MTSLTGGEIIFLPRPYKCGVLSQLTQPSFATFPLLISAATEASTLKFVIQLVFEGELHAKTTFEPKLAGVWAREAPQIFWDPFLFLQQFTELWTRAAAPIFWDPCLFLQRL